MTPEDEDAGIPMPDFRRSSRYVLFMIIIAFLLGFILGGFIK